MPRCPFVPVAGGVKCPQCGRFKATARPPEEVVFPCRVTTRTSRAVAARSQPIPDLPWWPKDADGLLIPQAELTAVDMPCPQRGAVVRAGEQCELCGQTERKYDVYACSQFGECSLIPSTRGAKLRDCLKCKTRQEAVGFALGRLPVVTAPVKRTGPVRVAILTPDLGAGGVERWIASMAKFLPRERAILTAVGIVADGQKWDPVTREITATGVPVYGTRRVRWGLHPTAESTVTFLETDAQVTRRTLAGADVVVSWGIADPGPLLAAAGWRGPHVVVSHGSSAWARNQLRKAVETATHCVAVSSDAARAFPLGVKAEIIWNGSEMERLAPTRLAAEVREAWGCTADQLLVGFVGRLSPEKNPLAVAHLVREMRMRMPGRDIRPVWVGTGLVDTVEKIKREAAAIAGARCVWVPPPAHIGDAWQALDLHVMASPEEGFSLVVTEALMAGVPTVATRVGIVPDILARWGKLVVPVDTNPTGEQLADAAELALFEGHRPNVTRARQVVWEEFTAARMGARWGAFLEGIA